MENGGQTPWDGIWVFPKIMVPPNHPILIGFSIIFTIHFGGFPPIFGNTHIPFYNQPHSYTLYHLCPWVPWCHSQLLELEISWSEKPWCVVSLWTSRHPFAVFLSILCNFPPKTHTFHLCDMWVLSFLVFFSDEHHVAIWVVRYSNTKKGAKDLSKTIWCSESEWFKQIILTRFLNIYLRRGLQGVFFHIAIHSLKLKVRPWKKCNFEGFWSSSTPPFRGANC